MSNASRDGNFVTTLLALSSVDGVTPVPVYADPVTHRLLVNTIGGTSPLTTKGDLYTFTTTDARLPVGTDGQVLTADSTQPTGLRWTGAGAGSVTSVSVVTANGLAGTVATATTTPAITLSTTVTGILQGNGTAISAATTTGSGAVVLASSPTLVTPNLGTPSAVTLTNATGLPLASGVTGTLPVLNGGTGTTTSTGTGSVVLSASPTLTGSVTVPTPTATTDAANKGYVDSVAQGLAVKPSAKVATTTALPSNTYNNGTSGVGATLTATSVGVLTVDGYNVLLNDYVLVKNEAAGANNGLYKCTTEGTASVAYVLTRAVEMDQSTEFVGAFMFVETGTVNFSSGWVCTNTTAPTIGTTAITFTQFSGAGEITAGNGLSKTGNTLSINTAVTVDLSTAQTLTNKTLTAPVIDTISNTGTITLPTATTTLVGRDTTDTLTNKYIQKRVSTTTSVATITPDKSTYDGYVNTAQAVGLTIANPSTMAVGDVVAISVVGTGAQTISFGTNYIAMGQALPTTTTAGKWMEITLKMVTSTVIEVLWANQQ